MSADVASARQVLGRLVGEELTGVRCTSLLELTVAGRWSVTIEDEYTFTTGAGERYSTADGQETVLVAALEAGVATPVTCVDVDDHGGLSLGVAGGLLQVAPCERFESWNVVGPHRQRVVSMPGGGLAVWS